MISKFIKTKPYFALQVPLNQQNSYNYDYSIFAFVDSAVVNKTRDTRQVTEKD